MYENLFIKGEDSSLCILTVSSNDLSSLPRASRSTFNK